MGCLHHNGGGLKWKKEPNKKHLNLALNPFPTHTTDNEMAEPRIVNLGQPNIITAVGGRPARKYFDIRQHYNAMNSSAVLVHHKNWFWFIMVILGYTLLTYDMILPVKASGNKRQKSEWVNETPYATWNSSLSSLHKLKIHPIRIEHE